LRNARFAPFHGLCLRDLAERSQKTDSIVYLQGDSMVTVRQTRVDWILMVVEGLLRLSKVEMSGIVINVRNVKWGT
jgi:hypothetical protein